MHLAAPRDTGFAIWLQKRPSPETSSVSRCRTVFGGHSVRRSSRSPLLGSSLLEAREVHLCLCKSERQASRRTGASSAFGCVMNCASSLLLPGGDCNSSHGSFKTHGLHQHLYLLSAILDFKHHVPHLRIFSLWLTQGGEVRALGRDPRWEESNTSSVVLMAGLLLPMISKFFHSHSV